MTYDTFLSFFSIICCHACSCSSTSMSESYKTNSQLFACRGEQVDWPSKASLLELPALDRTASVWIGISSDLANRCNHTLGLVSDCTMQPVQTAIPPIPSLSLDGRLRYFLRQKQDSVPRGNNMVVLSPYLPGLHLQAHNRENVSEHVSLEWKESLSTEKQRPQTRCNGTSQCKQIHIHHKTVKNAPDTK